MITRLLSFEASPTMPPRRSTGKIDGDPASIRRPPSHGDVMFSRAAKPWKEARRMAAPRRFFLTLPFSSRSGERLLASGTAHGTSE